MKTGILGGTFDPVHNGHLRIAEETMNHLGLSEVLFIPAARSPFKVDADVTAVEHRVKMVELAIEDFPGFRLSTIEIDRPGTSYSVDTLETLHETSQKGNELYFLIGLDSLEKLHHWKDAERIVSLCRIVTVCRPGYTMPQLKALEASISGLKRSLILLDEPQIDISSTGIRDRLRQGLDVSDMLPPKVEAYIKAHNLYT